MRTAPGGRIPVEDKEPLESDAVFGELADSFENKVNELFADGIVTTCVVVGRVLFAIDHLLRVKQTTVRTHAYLIFTHTHTHTDLYYRGKYSLEGRRPITTASAFDAEATTGCQVVTNTKWLQVAICLATIKKIFCDWFSLTFYRATLC